MTGVIEIHDNHVEKCHNKTHITNGIFELILTTLPLVGLLPWSFCFLKDGLALKTERGLGGVRDGSMDFSQV